ncbi:hypothetical protein NYO98_10390 [Nocardioides sp. STR2]|uniref:Uncharacterized protein n=1 Tax=Nocardioides pini TaxID=2975053 RepID=A0ABT4CE86_9ACTN|nr:hypothetical protein [Nocardioides pini]MCY4726686.1 hypothetical protein [Nocardioides pini]
MRHRATTQAAYPWRATIRTVFALVVAVAAVWGLVIEAAGVDPGFPLVAASIAVAGGITRVMALPGVNDIIGRFAPWLLAAPRIKDDDGPL